jgi:hypothetical protein
MGSIGDRITKKVLDLLKGNPEGIRYAELVRQISATCSLTCSMQTST